MFIKLTEQQQEIFDEFLGSVEKKENNIISSDQRQIGKTTIEFCEYGKIPVVGYI